MLSYNTKSDFWIDIILHGNILVTARLLDSTLAAPPVFGCFDAKEVELFTHKVAESEKIEDAWGSFMFRAHKQAIDLWENDREQKRMVKEFGSAIAKANTIVATLQSRLLEDLNIQHSHLNPVLLAFVQSMVNHLDEAAQCVNEAEHSIRVHNVSKELATAREVSGIKNNRGIITS